MEQTPVKKTNRLIKFIRWCSEAVRLCLAGLFGVFLMVGLVFRMPWRLPALFLMLLAALTIVPIRFRKWLYLLFTIIVIVVAAWILSPQSNNHNWQTYTPDNDTAGMTTPSVQDTDNAALVYNKILNDYHDDVFNFVFEDPDSEFTTLSAPWKSSQYPELVVWLATYENALAVLTEASQLPDCTFPVPSNFIELDEHMERLNLIKCWAKVIIRTANNDLAENRPHQALEKLLTVLRMAKHLYRQRSLFDLPAALSLELWAAEGLNRYILEYAKDPGELEIISLARKDVKTFWPENWKTILSSEKLVVKNLAGIMYQVNPAGRTRLTCNVLQAINERTGLKIRLGIFQSKFNRLTTLGAWLLIPHNPQDAEKLIDKSFDRFYRLTTSGLDLAFVKDTILPIPRLNCRWIIDLAARRSAAYYYPLRSQSRRKLSSERSTLILVALKQFRDGTGYWPQTLDEIISAVGNDTIIDPVSRNPFVYRLCDGGFTLYSMGKNKTDDNGIASPIDPRDDILIWPLNTKYREINTNDTQPENLHQSSEK